MRDAYKSYIYSTNLTGSQKAPSYLRALDLLPEMLKVAPLGFDDCKDIWSIDSVERLQELYLAANTEKHKGESSVWNTPSIPVEKIDACGNTSLKRAIYSTMDREALTRMKNIISNLEFIELNAQPTFQNDFINALLILNLTLDFGLTKK